MQNLSPALQEKGAPHRQKKAMDGLFFPRYTKLIARRRAGRFVVQRVLNSLYKDGFVPITRPVELRLVLGRAQDSFLKMPFGCFKDAFRLFEC
jgi:hypothetical protein